MHDNGGRNASPSSQIVPSNPTLKPFDQSKHTRIMENLKAAVLHRLTNSHPSKTLSSIQIAAVERALKQAFPSFTIPTHPTYASMIQRAIEGLNEEGGSMESSISEYIRANYEGLPWAHKSYLTHYLNILCENGEIVCTSDKCYTIPGLIHKPKSKKKQLRSKSGRKTKDDVTDEGNLGGGQLIVMSENEVCFQEEETQVYVRNRTKRRRSMVVYEDEEVGGKEIVVRERSLITSHQIAVIEGTTKVGEYSELRQHGFGIDDKGNDAAIIEGGLSKTQAGLIESTVEKLMPKDGQDEVRAEVLAVDQDSHKGRTGKVLPLVPSTLKKRLPGEWKNEAGIKTLQLDPESSDANLVPVPIEIAKNSALEERNHSSGFAELILSSTVGNQAWPSASGVDGDAPEDMLKNSARLERDENFRAAELMIVPFKGDTPISVIRDEMKPVLKERNEIIVCGLPSGAPVRPIQKPRLQRRKRLKDCEKKALLSLEKSVSTSPVSRMGPKLLEYKQKTEASLQTGRETEELMSTDDEDLNIPLHQVLQKCGKQRKLSEGITISKAPVAPMSSMSGGNLGAEPPGSGDVAMAKRKHKLTRSKSIKKQEQKLKSQLRVQDQKCDNLEVDNVAAPRSKVSSSFQLKEGCDNGQARHEGQEPRLADSVADVAADQCSMEHRHEQQRDGQVRGMGSHVELKAENLSLGSQSHGLGEIQQKVRDPGVEKASEVSLRESCLPQNHNEQKEEHMEQNQTKMVDVASCKPKRVTPPRQGETVEDTITASLVLQNQLCQEQQVPGEPSHNMILDAGNVVCPFDQKKGEELKNDGQIAHLDSDPTSTGGVASDNSLGQQLINEPFSAKLGSQCQHDHLEEQQGKDESEAGLANPQRPFHEMQNIKQKRDGCGRLLEKDAATEEDARADSNLYYEQLKGLSGFAAHQHSQQKKKQLKRDRCGRLRKTEVETEQNEATLLHQQQELPTLALDTALHASIASSQLDQKEGQQLETDQHIQFPDSELLATSETSSSLANQSDQMPREQTQHVQSKSSQSEAAVTSLDSQTLEQCQVEVLKSTPAPILTEYELHQQEKEYKPHREENLLYSRDEQSGKSQKQVHKMPSDQELVLSVNETPEHLKEHKEDGEGQLTGSKDPFVGQPCQEQEEEQCQVHEEKLGQLRDQGKTPKQKSAKTRAVKVPLSSKNTLRSRTKCRLRS